MTSKDAPPQRALLPCSGDVVPAENDGVDSRCVGGQTVNIKNHRGVGRRENRCRKVYALYTPTISEPNTAGQHRPGRRCNDGSLDSPRGAISRSANNRGEARLVTFEDVE